MFCPVERRVSPVSNWGTQCARSLPLPLRLVIVEEQKNLSVCDFVREVFGHESKNSAVKHTYQFINRDLATHRIWKKSSKEKCQHRVQNQTFLAAFSKHKSGTKERKGYDKVLACIFVFNMTARGFTN